MITISKNGEQLLLEYQAGRTNDATWVDVKLKSERQIKLPGRTFTFMPGNLLPAQDQDDVIYGYNDTRVFILGSLEGEYYKIRSDILNIKHDLLLSRHMELNHKTFTAHRDISIFAKIDSLIDEQIIIGGDADGTIPLEEFEYLLHEFPTSTELTHYADSRITRILKDYFNTMSDAQQKLSTYLEKKGKRLLATAGEARQSHQGVRNHFLVPYEKEKFEYVRNELKSMLQNAESYSEKAWQGIIINFLLLIFPKYIAVLPKLKVKDFYTNPQKTMIREIDITLVDAAGTIDIVEIKKPFAKCILSSGMYRDNYIPKKELAGSVMQVEKYLFHLSKWGYAGEKEILEKRKSELPNDFEIKITNPKGMIILGRDSDFAESQQWLDFEIIRRKYANLLDIITYDDLLRRLDNMITMLKHPAADGVQEA